MEEDLSAIFQGGRVYPISRILHQWSTILNLKDELTQKSGPRRVELHTNSVLGIFTYGPTVKARVLQLDPGQCQLSEKPFYRDLRALFTSG